MGRDVEDDLDRLRVGEGERERLGWDDDDDAFERPLGRGKKKESGLNEILDRSGGFRMLKYMLNDLSARLACGTYLFAYAIFSEYIPLAKKRRSVVTLTNKRPLAKYGCSVTSTSGV